MNPSSRTVYTRQYVNATLSRIQFNTIRRTRRIVPVNTPKPLFTDSLSMTSDSPSNLMATRVSSSMTPTQTVHPRQRSIHSIFSHFHRQPFHRQFESSLRTRQPVQITLSHFFHNHHDTNCRSVTPDHPFILTRHTREVTHNADSPSKTTLSLFH